ncbi:MAG: bifunctional UDP-N-acetylmuramoyl-tripeptide:D-alanyl-D-alanine ligase/alanine racemase, partial [Sediminibacterium sp.]|nr:bifunctional UDP-N-acetylmuramoyl-tripeptide:D-alanyl-D-alanine ligase/alanine racemase [Sediminibacterium sp.]
MPYSIQNIAEITGAEASFVNEGALIEYLLIDSRKIVFPQTSLFFAISGPRRDGHQFLKEVYDRGVRNFIVREDPGGLEGANILQVPDVLTALQGLAARHRAKFSIPVIGVTGSNGKTIVKEWLYQLLQQDHNIVRSPRSYNSQIGVPLSIWQMSAQHTLGIFEAGISTVDEMQRLARVIQPTAGIFTNLAEAHREGFENNRQKALEKAMLFKHVQALVFCKEALLPSLAPDTVDQVLFAPGTGFFSWSRETEATLRILAEEKNPKQTKVTARFAGNSIVTTIPFTDRVSVDNAITCWCVLLQMQYSQPVINERMLKLEAVDMRMQLKKGINNCYLLNDSYSNDTASLDLAVDHLQQQAGTQRTTLILSDILQSGQDEEILYHDIAEQLAVRGINRLIGIGPAISRQAAIFTAIPGAEIATAFYASTDEFLHQVSTQQFRDEYILLKGARVFEFERISNWLEQKVHQTVMEIDLSAMVHNLKEYQRFLKPATRLMAMVKAFSYGSGSAEIARLLQFHKVDYLAVAYADEGVELRKAGISLPIMVMNTDEAAYDALVNYDLEPEVYSFHIYRTLHTYLRQQGIQQFPVHIKFNTGMHRLGFEVADAGAIASLLKTGHTMAVNSVFSHLAASEDPELDAFTQKQVMLFDKACEVVQQQLDYPFLRHIANSAAIIR